ncbi:MAG: FHA domain-containing protein, partial [Polyangiaceae bacterium]|nr:FHA domain-containing protein [Polyangiaceae bacterium]
FIDAAGRFAAKLATATAKAGWVDFVFELYQSQARPCPAPVIDELNTAVRKVSGIDLSRLREYLALLHQKQPTLGPAERFLLQRIEGLERLAALR